METSFFDSLIDNFGIWQHTDGETIIKAEGYALDDAARGLLVCLALNKTDQAEVLFDYVQKSQHQNRFYGFTTKKHRFIKFPASDDATGQVIWAMGYAYSTNFHKTQAKKLLEQLIPTVMDFKFMRGYAYALLGTIYIDQVVSKQIANKLMAHFKDTSSEWLWPEPSMTYGNGIIPYALLRYAKVTGDQKIGQFGLEVLEFVEKKCISNRLLAPIGNEGWLLKGSDQVPTFSQQPIDAAYMLWGWIAAWEYFQKDQYYLQAQRWLTWFEGNNVLEKSMYDKETLECYDGIDEKGINYHSGAESNICLLLSLYMINNKKIV